MLIYIISSDRMDREKSLHAPFFINYKGFFYISNTDSEPKIA